MKLKRIKINNFLQIENADIDLSCPVNIFLGKNFQGKSSIVDAIIFPFLGMLPSREITKKKNAHWLSRGYGFDGKGFNIELETDKGVYAATEKRHTKSPIDAKLIQVLANPQAVLDMKPADRLTVFAAILKSEGTKTKIEDCLSRNNGFGPEVYDMVLDDMDKAQKWAVEQRQLAHQTITALKSTKGKAPASVVDVGGRTFDLTKLENMQVIDDRIAELTAERDSLVKVKEVEVEADAESIKVLVDSAQAVVDGIPAKIQSIHETIHDLEAKLVEANEVYDSAELRHDQSCHEYNLTKLSLDELDKCEGNAACRSCRQTVSDEYKVSLLEKLNNDLAIFQADKKERERICKEKEKVVLVLQETIKNQNEAIEELEESKKNNSRTIEDGRLMIENIENQQQIIENIKKNDEKIELNQEIKIRYLEYQGYLKNNKDVDTQIREAEDRHAQMDKLDKLLRPEGELRKIACSDLETVDFDKPLQKAWGMESLMISSEGDILFRKAPIGLASGSEKYMASILLAELLARKMGVGILILDGTEIFMNEIKTPLFSRLAEWITRFQNIILVASMNKPPEPPKTNWIKMWWVSNGEFSPLAGNVVSA